MTSYIGNKPTNVPLSNDDLVNSSITINGSAVSLGGSTTITTGTDWQSVVTASTLNAVSGKGYPIDTTSNTCTITMPSNPSVGDTIVFVDYARNFGTNKIIINQNSKNFQGNASPNPEYNTNAQSITCVYINATQGWIPTTDDDVTFETLQSYAVDFLCIAGGGGAGTAGGGAGGYRNSYNSETSGGGGSSESSFTITQGSSLTITIGAGGAGVESNVTCNDGNSSSISGTGISTITSVGGGGSGTTDGGNPARNGRAGGSGGGGAGDSAGTTGGSGTANQGYDGGTAPAPSPYPAGGGGGAGAVGQNATGSTSGNGGNGVSSSITASSVIRAGGGAGGGVINTVTAGTGGSGGGGNGAGNNSNGSNATANTGSGGGGLKPYLAGYVGGNGASGVIILRMPTANYSGTTSGSPTVTTSGSDTIITFNASGSYST